MLPKRVATRRQFLRQPTVAVDGDGRLEAGCGKFHPNRIGVIALVREQYFDAVAGHPEQRAKALLVVPLARRQDEAEGSAVSIAPGGKLGGKAAARPPKPLGL
ncbi:hypothetical protein SPH9361_04540 [Sphingobium sp. CECT 9361]|nr:hypothetical protein SPH9361_04540 [Sphingobium sp. CECT 9361]